MMTFESLDNKERSTKEKRTDVGRVGGLLSSNAAAASPVQDAERILG